jgi:agmatinase
VPIDPSERWASLGLEKPEYAGFVSYADLPYTERAAELHGFDVAIVGAAVDELCSDRPGTRFGPRAIRMSSIPPLRQLETGVDWGERLRAVDYGDAPIVPADPVKSHAGIERTVGDVLAAGVIPIVLGGDHSVSEPTIRACAQTHGAVGVIHFDTHTDTARELYGAELSHGTPFYKLVESAAIDPTRYAQIGLRGYWPGEAELAWQRERGITSFFMHDVRRLGLDEVLAQAIAAVGDGPVFLTVDVDVLDPAYAPGTGTPEPGGMTSAELLGAARRVAAELSLVGADVVEVLPTLIGSADITALVADRIVREILTGMAIRREAPTDGAARVAGAVAS